MGKENTPEHILSPTVSFLVEFSKGAVLTRRPEDEAFLVPALDFLSAVSICPNAVALSSCGKQKTHRQVVRIKKAFRWSRRWTNMKLLPHSSRSISVIVPLLWVFKEQPACGYPSVVYCRMEWITFLFCTCDGSADWCLLRVVFHSKRRDFT